jgi:type II secretory pathway predicted ATPase ExeA
MYEKYWELERRPFESSADSRWYYPGESHQGAMLKLRYAIENRLGAAMLCGPSGSGKSLLFNQLRRYLPKQFRPCVQLLFPQMPAPDLLAYLADELAAPKHSDPQTIDRTVRRIQQFLIQNVAEDQHAVIAIEEAHLIDNTRAFEALRLLLNVEVDGRPALTLVLIGEPGLLVQIARMPALEERLAVKCLIRAFTADETAAYVNFRLQAAGAKRPIFEPEAISALYELTHGLPRKINRLCDLALVIGFAEERSTIAAEQLEAVAEELVAVTPE